MPPASRGGRCILPVLSLLCSFLCATVEGRLLDTPDLKFPLSQNREVPLREHAEHHDTLSSLENPHPGRSSQAEGKSTDSLLQQWPQLDTGSGAQRTPQSDKRSLRQNVETDNPHGSSSRDVLKRSKLGQNMGLFPYMPALFAFGDSDFDLGNTLYLNVTPYKAAMFPPYGESYKGSGTLWGRFCDGLLVPDYLGEQRLQGV